MTETMGPLKKRVKIQFEKAKTLSQLEASWKQYLGKKGELTLILRSLGQASGARRKRLGKQANELRDFIREQYQNRLSQLRQNVEKREKKEWFDVTAPGTKIERGHLHPLTQVQRKAQEIFQSMGFEVAEGPEIETEWYNFDALNIPKDHPARDMWDTFWIKSETRNPKPETNSKSKSQSPKLLLRTHTSPVQIRYMETHQPPLRVISPGRIFRYEATDANHEINFYQLEGLMVGKEISAAHFTAIIQEFYRRFFARPVRIRLRPSYFPFTEPSFEVDMTCLLCEGKGCQSCSKGGWLEIMGAGMVHPNVFKAVGYNPKEWQGFAFGMGLDRLAMMKYKINDIRLFYSGDLRFLHQF